MKQPTPLADIERLLTDTLTHVGDQVHAEAPGSSDHNTRRPPNQGRGGRATFLMVAAAVIIIGGFAVARLSSGPSDNAPVDVADESEQRQREDTENEDSSGQEDSSDEGDSSDQGDEVVQMPDIESSESTRDESFIDGCQVTTGPVYFGDEVTVCTRIPLDARFDFFNNLDEALTVQTKEGPWVLQPQRISAPESQVETPQRISDWFDVGRHRFTGPSGQFRELVVVETAVNPLGAMTITARGVGPIEAGMSIGEAERLLGTTIVSRRQMVGPDSTCGYARIADTLGLVRFRITWPKDVPLAEATIDVVEASSRLEDNSDGDGYTRTFPEQSPKTQLGIGIGSSEDEVLAAYGEQVEVTGSKYGTERDHNVYYYPDDDKDEGFVVRFFTVDGVVVGADSGAEAEVSLHAGCL